MPKISICVPIHDMQNGAYFLWRLVNSLTEQSFKDWELIVTKEGKMAENTNAAIARAKGELIKILYLDDYFAHPNSLQDIVDAFNQDTQWLITGVDTNPNPQWTDDIATGNNKLGSPSALTIRNHHNFNQYFDESLSWVLDCDYYKRMYDFEGEPVILNGINVIIGQGEHQMTHILTNEAKLAELKYLNEKNKKEFASLNKI